MSKTHYLREVVKLKYNSEPRERRELAVSAVHERACSTSDNVKWKLGLDKLPAVCVPRVRANSEVSFKVVLVHALVYRAGVLSVA